MSPESSARLEARSEPGGKLLGYVWDMGRRGPKTQTLEEAYEARVVRGGPGECWGWRGAFDDGYTAVNNNHRKWYGHRLAYFLATGELPEHVHHHCRNTGCVNPAHLQAMPNNVEHQHEEKRLRDLEITFDLEAKACPRNHDPKFVKWYASKGKRVRMVKSCLACARERRSRSAA